MSIENRMAVDEVYLYNQMGQVMPREEQVNLAIDVSMLLAGIYIVDLVTHAANVGTGGEVTVL